MSDIIPIFAGGVGRSGTTMPAYLLKYHPDVFTTDSHEAKFIVDGFGLLDLCFGMRTFPKTETTTYGRFITFLNKFNPIKLRFKRFRKMINQEWWPTTEHNSGGGLESWVSFDILEKLLDEFESNLNNPVEAARNFTFGIIKNHKDYKGQKYWIDTSPLNIAYADLIYKIFPETKFIEVRRNPLDNITSILKQGWGPNNEDLAIKWWSNRIQMADRAISKIPSRKHLLLSFEDLIKNDRENVYKQVCSFLQISQQNPDFRRFFNEHFSPENANLDSWKTSLKYPNIFKNKFKRFVDKSGYDYKIDINNL